MTASAPFTVSRHLATDLIDLAWDLACSAGVAVRFDHVNTARGVEPCVSARCVPGEHPVLLVPRSPECVEVWWGRSDDEVELVGVAADVPSLLALARLACTPRKRRSPARVVTAQVARISRGHTPALHRRRRIA